MALFFEGLPDEQRTPTTKTAPARTKDQTWRPLREDIRQRFAVLCRILWRLQIACLAGQARGTRQARVERFCRRTRRRCAIGTTSAGGALAAGATTAKAIFSTGTERAAA